MKNGLALPPFTAIARMPVIARGSIPEQSLRPDCSASLLYHVAIVWLVSLQVGHLVSVRFGKTAPRAEPEQV
ncbi:hypothetical protein ACFLVX_00145 [Chloroflexota bacterium]